MSSCFLIKIHRFLIIDLRLLRYTINNNKKKRQSNSRDDPVRIEISSKIVLRKYVRLLAECCLQFKRVQLFDPIRSEASPFNDHDRAPPT